MKIKFLVTLITLLLAVSLLAAPPAEKVNLLPDRLLKPAVIDNTSYINANRIFMFVTNHGNFGRDLSGMFGYDYGTWFPYTSIDDIRAGKDNSPFYAGGLWVGAIDSATKETRVTVAEYSDEYVPGPMSNGTFETDQPEFRVYKLFKDSTAANPNQDYMDFIKYAIPQGAPFKVTESGDTIPDFKGDQSCWSIYNDANPPQHSNQAGKTKPLGIEIKGSIFAFDQQGSLGNIVFLRWRVFNKGQNTLQNCIFSVWSDPDLGGSGDDFVGCDTLLSVGYIYNATNSDQYYGATPPCLGIDFFQGPLRARTAGDTLPDGQPVPDGRMWGGRYSDSVNIGMYAFNKYINGTDPRSASDSYNRMNGSNNDGSPYTYNGQVLRYMHSGDPVTGTGDLDIVPADRRMWITTGPVTFRPGDSTEILAAMVIGQGTDRLNSITVMKTLDAYAQKVYDNDFNPPSPPAKPVVTLAQLPGEVTLSWTDTSEVDQGDYHFEGYTVWQSPDGISNWRELATYDLINDRNDALVDTIADTTRLTFPIVRRKLTNSGLVHSFTTKFNGVEGGSLKDLTPYYFRVSAFSFDYIARDGGIVPNGDRLLESQTTVTAIPRAPVAGLHPILAAHDSVPTVHSSGVSDGIVRPLVIDPAALTGDSYKIYFGADTLIVSRIDSTLDSIHVVVLTDTCSATYDTVSHQIVIVLCADSTPFYTLDPVVETTLTTFWNLDNTTTNKTALKKQYNLSGDDDYRVVDGIMVKVQGPPTGFRIFQVVANGNGVLNPPVAGAFGFAGFPTGVDETGAPLDPDSATQQVGGGKWGFHTADNGGTCGGGDRGSYDAFLARATRSGGNNAAIGIMDWEMRFTGSPDQPGVDGSWAREFSNEDKAWWVPFELWNIGIGTPNNTADDYRLVPWIVDDGSDDIYNLESWGCINDTNPVKFGGDGEHSVSGGNNDPFTDWVYWYNPIDKTGGEAGYLKVEAFLKASNLDSADAYVDNEVLARTVLVEWNGHKASGDTLTLPPQFIQNLPEKGTIFRLTTGKPNAPTDTFTFVAPAPLKTTAQADLDKITAVPNPFYLYGRYDVNPGSNLLKFHHLPVNCKISIYNLAGDLMRIIDKNDPTPIASWDLLTTNGLPVASGIYIYVVDAPGFGQKIGKVAIFTESEVLKIY